MLTLFRAPTALVLALVLFVQSVAYAGNKDIGEARRRLEAINVKNMTLPQLQEGLKELRTTLAKLDDDLDNAEHKHDKRLAVKVRNYGAMGLAAMAVLLIASEARCTGPDCGGAAMVLFLLGPVGVALILGTQGYIYLTEGELRALRKVTQQLRDKIDRIENKIEQRRAEQN